MSLKTEIFYVEKGVGSPQALNELLSTLPASHIEDLRALAAQHGLIALTLLYEATNFKLLRSSPLDGANNVFINTPVFLVFSESFEDVSTSSVAVQLEGYRSGLLAPIGAGDVTISGNRIKITGLVDGTSGGYYQLLIKSGLAAKSKHTLGTDLLLNWKTA